MIIIVDAYNVLKQMIAASGHVKDKERQDFIYLLAYYGRLKGHEIVVIFDGGDCQWPVREMVAGIEGVYSGAGRTADEVIKNYLSEGRGREILLVTTDRALNNHAAHFDIPSMDAQDFYVFIRRTAKHESHERAIDAKKRNVIIKTSNSHDAEVDALMTEYTKQITPKLEEKAEYSNKSESRRVAKSERNLFKIMKKL